MQKLRLAADLLSFDRARRTITLRGKVAARLGRLRLNAARLLVSLDAKGHPTSMEASGGVTIQIATCSTSPPAPSDCISRGSAGRLRLLLSAKQRRLELSGGARLELRNPDISVEGKQIWLELDSGRLAVQQARVNCLLSPDRSPPARPEVDDG